MTEQEKEEARKRRYTIGVQDMVLANGTVSIAQLSDELNLKPAMLIEVCNSLQEAGLLVPVDGTAG